MKWLIALTFSISTSFASTAPTFCLDAVTNSDALEKLNSLSEIDFAASPFMDRSHPSSFFQTTLRILRSGSPADLEVLTTFLTSKLALDGPLGYKNHRIQAHLKNLEASDFSRHHFYRIKDPLMKVIQKVLQHKVKFLSVVTDRQTERETPRLFEVSVEVLSAIKTFVATGSLTKSVSDQFNILINQLRADQDGRIALDRLEQTEKGLGTFFGNPLSITEPPNPRLQP